MANGAMGSESGGGVGECNFILLLMGTVIHYKLVLLLNSYKCHRLSWVFHKNCWHLRRKRWKGKICQNVGKRAIVLFQLVQ